MSSENNSVEKVYTYEITNKNGKTVTKRVVRKYTNKKDTTNTLQNKANKETILLLSKTLNVPKSSIEILFGDKSKLKTFYLPITENDFRIKLMNL